MKTITFKFNKQYLDINTNEDRIKFQVQFENNLPKGCEVSWMEFTEYYKALVNVDDSVEINYDFNSITIQNDRDYSKETRDKLIIALVEAGYKVELGSITYNSIDSNNKILTSWAINYCK